MQMPKTIILKINADGLPEIDYPKGMSKIELLGIFKIFDKLILLEILDKIEINKKESNG